MRNTRNITSVLLSTHNYRCIVLVQTLGNSLQLVRIRVLFRVLAFRIRMRACARMYFFFFHRNITNYDIRIAERGGRRVDNFDSVSLFFLYVLLFFVGRGTPFIDSRRVWRESSVTCAVALAVSTKQYLLPAVAHYLALSVSIVRLFAPFAYCWQPPPKIRFTMSTG